MATNYRTMDGDVLDLICWQEYGIQSGAVEAVLAANRELADRGAIYASGLVITLPDIARPEIAAPTRLWD